MFSFLSFANADFEIVSSTFLYIFNIDSSTFPEDRAIHENFEQKGFESLKFIINCSSILAIYFLIILITPFVLILKNVFRYTLGCGKYWYEVEEGFKWSGLIKFYFETSLEFFMCAFINVMYLKFDTAMNVFNSCFAVVVIIFTLSFPIYVAFFLSVTSPKQKKDPEIEIRYGSLYTEYRQDHWYQYMFNIAFMARRCLYVMILVIFYNSPFLQLVMFQCLNVAYMGMLLFARPYHDGIVNFFAVLNELFLFIIGCYLFMYLDDSITRANQYFFGKPLLYLNHFNSVGDHRNRGDPDAPQRLRHDPLQDRRADSDMQK
jgi:hypothetical protein